MTYTVENLKAMHTRRLLKVLNAARAERSALYGTLDSILASRSMGPAERDNVDDYPVSGWALGYESGEPSGVTIADLKAILATRPHVPNKKEGRAMRREKNRLNRGKGRANR